MSTAEDHDEHKSKPWTPRVITGGKGPPDFPGPPVDNWLTNLPIGTTFTAQPKSSSAEKNLYSVVFHSVSGETTLLMWKLPDGKVLDMYFNPESFCRMHFSPDILGTIPTEKQEEDDGKRDPDGDWAD